jgi:phosphomevalonate kinase
MLATARVDANASGGDLAAGVWGGWLAYRAPDRAALLAMARRRGVEEAVRAPWPGFGVRRLPPPRRLALQVGWTGRPAHTASLVSDLRTRPGRGGASYAWFVARTTACVRGAIRAFERGDRDDLLRRIRAGRRVLARLDDEVRLGIFTPELTALCDAAESVGGAAKPSGAGGGDCGIALLDAEAGEEISRLRARWTAAGIRPVPIEVPQPSAAPPGVTGADLAGAADEGRR